MEKEKGKRKETERRCKVRKEERKEKKI